MLRLLRIRGGWKGFFWKGCGQVILHNAFVICSDRNYCFPAMTGKHFPLKPYTTTTFSSGPLPLIHSECDRREGIAAFRIQILFREHYTWQGRLVWLNENQEVVFHSAIELLQLLVEVLAE
mgnify:CR=1 FL=1